MKILLIRHAIAEDRETFARTGRPERERPLTDEGRKKMLGAARGLHRLIPELDVLGTSPYVRAAETTDVVVRVYREPLPELCEFLAPDGSREDMIAWLRHHAAKQNKKQPARGGKRAGEDMIVALVGHEPWLSETIGWLLTGEVSSLGELRKGGACLLDFRKPPGPGRATLSWLLTPQALRGLSK